MPHRDDFDDDLMDASSEAYDYKPVASDETGGSKAAKLFVSVTVIAAIAGAAWYFLGAEKLNQDNIPIVRADTSLTKEKPNEPGGMSVPNRDKTIYELLDGNNTEPKLERLLPPPEQPLEKPTLTLGLPALDEPVDLKNGLAEVVKAPELTAQAKENAKALPAIPDTAMAEEIKAPSPALMADPNAPRALVKRSEKPQGPDTQDKAGLAQKISEALKEKVSPPVKALKPLEKTVTVAPTVKKKPPLTKGYLLQLLSSKSESGVKAAWEKIKTQNKTIVKSIPAQVVRADLGAEKGIYYRLRLGPVPTSEKAKSLCSQLKKRKVGCFIVRIR